LRPFIFSLLVFLLHSQNQAWSSERDSAFLFEEPISESSHSHKFDWVSQGLEFEVAYAPLFEKNNFSSYMYHFGLNRAVTGSIIGRFALRTVHVASTNSTNMLALTPFSQAAQGERTELMLGLGFPLLAGRSFSRLSPILTDLDHVFQAQAAIHYTRYPVAKDLMANDPPSPLPGQRVLAYTFAAELGLRFKIGLPRALSLFTEFDIDLPITNSDPDLPYWAVVLLGMSWNFDL
jgi:hypothetical protein